LEQKNVQKSDWSLEYGWRPEEKTSVRRIGEQSFEVSYGEWTRVVQNFGGYF